MSKEPAISIVTVTYNAEKYLAATIESAIGQAYSNKEIILIDGGSTDLTLDTIKRYRQQINRWVSEADTGIADAMNKGLRLCSGEYVIFLHADDYFYSEAALEQAVGFIDDVHAIFACDILYGKELRKLSPRGFNFWCNFKTPVLHQGVLCKKSLFDAIGLFDTNYKIAMDYDFFLRAYRARAKLKTCPVSLSVMRDSGISSRTDWPSLAERFEEERDIHSKNCRSRVMANLYRLYWGLYLSYRRAKSAFSGLSFSD